MEPEKIEDEIAMHNGEPWQIIRVVVPIAKNDSTRYLEVTTILTEEYALRIMERDKDYESVVVDAIRSAVRGAIRARRKAEGKDV